MILGLTIQEVLKHGCISSQTNIHLYFKLAKISTKVTLIKVHTTLLQYHMHQYSNLLSVMLALILAASFASGTVHVYNPNISVFSLRFNRTCCAEAVLMKMLLDGAPRARGIMVLLGKNHSPTLPPSKPRQHCVLTLSVTQTRASPGSSVFTRSPTSTRGRLPPSDILVPFHIKKSWPDHEEREDSDLIAIDDLSYHSQV
jgi:hypothetical protein